MTQSQGSPDRKRGGDTAAGASAQLWGYVALDQFQAPRSSTTQAMHRGLAGLLDRLEEAWQWLRRGGKPAPPESPVVELDLLERIPESRLDHIAPCPKWDGTARALDEALESWLDTEATGARVKVVVGAPHGGTAEAITAWAHGRGWTLVEPPPHEEILSGDMSWLEGLAEGADHPLVIPHLERCYLRHHQGLTLLRRLVDWLMTRQRRCLIGCSSWAWSFLGRTIGLDAVFATPLTLQALDQERLQRWFAELVARSHDELPGFRQTDSGRWVLPPPGTAPEDVAGDAEGAAPGPEISAFLGHLAAHSRGIPGVAWAIWRHSLRLVPDEENGDEVVESTGLATTYWVRPWLQLRLPAMAESPERDTLFVLHALLLHGFLPVNVLARILPLTDFRIMQLLDALRSRGIVESAGGEAWQIASLGYPTVRQALVAEGYLVDAL